MIENAKPEASKLNWRRGLFQVWLSGSAAWVFAIGWAGYDRFASIPDRHAEQMACSDLRRANPALGNPVDCFAPGTMFADLIPVSDFVREFAPLALLPVLGSLVVGITVLWIVSGFRASKIDL